MTFVIDTSHYQGVINWEQVKADGCVGAYVKATDGAFGVDADWQTHRAGANAVGIPVGPYHFAEGGNVSAEAAHFASIWSAGWQLHPALDYEIAGVNATWLVAFRTDFRQDTEYRPFRVYASESNLTGALNPAGWIDSNTTIWAARYNSTLGWTHPQLVLWQNTSAANIPGIVGSVDEDQFMNGWTPAADQGDDMGALQDIDPNWLQLIARVSALSQGLGTAGAGSVSAPNPKEVSIGAALAGLPAKLDASTTALAADITTEQSAILTAVQGIQAGTVDVAQLAQALVPILAPADADAFLAAFTAQLGK